MDEGRLMAAINYRVTFRFVTVTFITAESPSIVESDVIHFYFGGRIGLFSRTYFLPPDKRVSRPLLDI